MCSSVVHVPFTFPLSSFTYPLPSCFSHMAFGNDDSSYSEAHERRGTGFPDRFTAQHRCVLASHSSFSDSSYMGISDLPEHVQCPYSLCHPDRDSYHSNMDSSAKPTIRDQLSFYPLGKPLALEFHRLCSTRLYRLYHRTANPACTLIPA